MATSIFHSTYPSHPIPMAFNVQCYRQRWPSFVLPKREDFAAFILQVERRQAKHTSVFNRGLLGPFPKSWTSTTDRNHLAAIFVEKNNIKIKIKKQTSYLQYKIQQQQQQQQQQQPNTNEGTGAVLPLILRTRGDFHWTLTRLPAVVNLANKPGNSECSLYI